MLEQTWQTLNGEPIENVTELVRSLMTDTANGMRELHIGTDSQQAGQRTEFVTVLVVRQVGKGGRVFYTRQRMDRIKSLKERLLREVYMSVELGLQLNAMIPETVGLTVHVDANPDVNFRSSDYVKELAGMVMGQGFKTLLKPDSWAATHAADHVVKHKVLHM